MMVRKNDAVSPVIGTILMVAITVILAAIIAAFVFGMTGNVQKTKVVSLVAERSGNSEVQVTNFGGQDSKDLQSVIVSAGGSASVVSGTGNLGSGVGSSSKYTCVPGKRLMVTGLFRDGSKVILIDRTM